MRRNFLLVCTILALTACGTQQTESADSEVVIGAEGRYYGGTFRVNETDHFETLYPPKISLAISQRVGSVIYEGLVKLDQKDLTLKPVLAESWDVDSSGTRYSFTIRKGVMFHDDACFPDEKGREVSAMDFKKCYENLAKYSEDNSGYEKIFKDKVKGANEFHEASKTGEQVELSGLQVNGNVFTIELIEPQSNFLFMLAMANCYLYPMEAYEKYGEDMHVGTGAFRVKSINGMESLTLEKNPNYYMKDEYGNQLPFLDEIHMTFISETDSVVGEFIKGNYDLIYALPTDYIIDIEEQALSDTVSYQSESTSEMLVQYYEFLNQNSIFSDVRVRQAFNYAINRDLIRDKVMQGEVISGKHGITPGNFEGYDVSQIKGYDFNVEKAKSLLAEAGYSRGQDFPEITIDINEGTGGVHTRVAEEIKAQLMEYLDIKVNINVLPFVEKVAKSRKGESVMWRSGWRGDYPHPESFLSLFYGRDVPEDITKESYPNTARYVNPKFDELYEKGLHAKTIEESYAYFLEAEQLAMAEAPVLILYYSENYRILQPNVANFPNNAMQYRDYNEVYFDQGKNEAEVVAEK